LRQPETEVVVLERNKADDTFGWGVVLSDETLDNLHLNDPISAASIKEHFAYWDDIAVHHQGRKMLSSGHGFCGIGRRQLLLLLQDRARELGVELRFEVEVGSASEYADDYDIVVASDGLNSNTRKEFDTIFRADVQQLRCQFVWLGTKQKFDDAFTFIFEQTDKGWVWAHAYQFDDDTATFIVECSQSTFDAYGFSELDQQQSIAICEKIFKDHLGGHALMTNANHIRGSAWIQFPRVLCDKWSHKNMVLLGDASATAHFSIGSGTKLALESAAALAKFVTDEPDLDKAFSQYEDARRLEVLRLQSAARNSVEWFSHENLRLRDPKWLESAEKWFQEQAGVAPGSPVRPPMFAPFTLRDMQLKNRVVVSPMAQYKAVDGNPTDWHLVHYGERAWISHSVKIIGSYCLHPLLHGPIAMTHQER